MNAAEFSKKIDEIIEEIGTCETNSITICEMVGVLEASKWCLLYHVKKSSEE